MIDFYYQIKGKDVSGFGNWAWPPVFSGRVTAENKKEAKLVIEEDYGREFPLRVLSKDIDNHEYLLRIQESSDHTERLFEVKECKQCGNKFRTIDLYNDINESYKGDEFCREECRHLNYEDNRPPRAVYDGSEKPVIYGIRHVYTQQIYIGKTTQVFTLRWYQHFYHGGDTKFHQAIQDSDITDWEFKVLEQIIIPNDVDSKTYIASREKHFIDMFDSIENGYNTMDIKH